jgi:hypothetical protein
MNSTTILLTLMGILIVLYILKRRARLKSDDE